MSLLLTRKYNLWSFLRRIQCSWANCHNKPTQHPLARNKSYWTLVGQSFLFIYTFKVLGTAFLGFNSTLDKVHCRHLVHPIFQSQRLASFLSKLHFTYIIITHKVVLHGAEKECYLGHFILVPNFQTVAML